MSARKPHISVMLTQRFRQLLQHMKAYDGIPSSQRIEDELKRSGAWDRWEQELAEKKTARADAD